MVERQFHLKSMLGPELLDRVNKSKVLVVGAGGIGCELLKDLVLSGFHDIVVTDLDTIDISNLNRQFLFRPAHVGRSKADVAREAVLAMNPAATIVAYHSDIINDPRFNIKFFERFDLVFNALDNLKARQHVNSMCARAARPLLEAGTSGHSGQAQPILKGVTECYDCTPKPVAKTFAICTIRSTPSQPVHCVEWAKQLHRLLVGNASESSLWEGAKGGDEERNVGGMEGAGPGAGGVKHDSAYMAVVFPRPASSAALSEVQSYARRVFQAIFHDDIARRLELPGAYRTSAVRPVALDLTNTEGQAGLESAGGAAAAHALNTSSLPDQRVLSTAESTALFLDALSRYYHPLPGADEAGAVGSQEWSKDSPVDLDLVTAACNLRATIFHIPVQSKFEVKSIAGNIIPAIATSNAMVAGLQVLEGLKMLRDGFKPEALVSTGRCTWLQARGSSTSAKCILSATRLDKPNPECPVCGVPYVTAQMDTEAVTFGRFIDEVLVGKLSFIDPSVDSNNGSSSLMYCRSVDEDDAEYEEMALSALPGGGLKDGRCITVNEGEEGRVHKVNVIIEHAQGAQGISLRGDLPGALASASRAVAAYAQAEKAKVAAIARQEEVDRAAAGRKRKRGDMGDAGAALDGAITLDDSEEEEEGNPAKRSNVGTGSHGSSSGAGASGAPLVEESDVIEVD